MASNTNRQGLEFVLALLSGVLLALAMPPFDQSWLMWVGVVPLLLAIHGQPFRRVVGYSYLAGFVFFSSFWYSVLPWGLPVALVVCLTTPFFFVCTMGCWAILLPTVPRGARLVLLPAVWVAMEYICMQWLSFPMIFAITQAKHPAVIQIAGLLGPYGISALTVLTNTALADLIIHCLGRKSASWLPGIGRWLAYGVVMLLVVLNLGYGQWVVCHANTDTKGPVVDVTLLQPAMESRLYLERWVDTGRAGEFIDAVLKITANLPNPTPGRSAISVWPEGGNGFYNLRVAWIRQAMAQFAKDRRTYLAMSSVDLSEDGKQFNSVFWIDPDGQFLARYDKRLLVPIGEAGLTAGEDKDASVFEGGFGRLGPMICAESNFPRFARYLTRQGAEILLISSSDASFRRSSLSLGHTRMAILRAVESRRPVLLSANVGPSLIVDPYGRIQGQTGFWEQTTLTGTVTPVSKRSPYHQAGYLLAPILLGLVSALLGRAAMSRKGRRPASANHSIKLRLSAGGRWLAAAGASCVVSLFLCSASLLEVNQLTPQPYPALQALAAFCQPLPRQVRPVTAHEFRQASRVTCGSAAVAYLLSIMGRQTSEDDVNALVKATDRGIDLYSLKRALEGLGFQASGEEQNYEALKQIAKPVIAHVRDDHYVVVIRADTRAVIIFDPALGEHIRLERADFEQAWHGVVLLVRPQPIPRVLGDAGASAYSGGKI